MITKQYYNSNAAEFIESTFNVDLKPIYLIFESYLKPSTKLLDVGFGSGRDSLHFYQKRYDVVSIDSAEQIVKRGKILLNTEVLLVDFFTIRYNAEFDAIWASAFFLHFTNDEIQRGLELCYNALKADGVLYLSFKYGVEETFRHGRFFNDFNEQKFQELLKDNKQWLIEEQWVTEDARPQKQGKKWLNIIMKKI